MGFQEYARGAFRTMIWLGIIAAMIAGFWAGFYRGRRFERKRISKALATNAVAGISQVLRAGSVLRPGKTKDEPGRKPWRPPGDETRH